MDPYEAHPETVRCPLGHDPRPEVRGRHTAPEVNKASVSACGDLSRLRMASAAASPGGGGASRVFLTPEEDRDIAKVGHCLRAEKMSAVQTLLFFPVPSVPLVA